MYTFASHLKVCTNHTTRAACVQVTSNIGSSEAARARAEAAANRGLPNGGPRQTSAAAAGMRAPFLLLLERRGL